jgi:Ras family protein A
VVVQVKIEDTLVQLVFWDTPPEADNLRKLSPPDTSVVLISFAVDDPDSLINVADKVRDPLSRCSFLIWW